MNVKAKSAASFTLQDGARALVTGVLDMNTVGPLLATGGEAIAADRARIVDLSGVSAGDSAGLALLIEWLSVARGAGRELRYEHIPQQMQQLARLSEVEELLLGA